MTTGVARAPAEAAELGAAELGALADQIVSAVTRCPDVAGLTQRPGSPVATYLPGRTVSGVALRPAEVEICVVARYGRPLGQIAAEVRMAVAPLVPGRVVDVTIADITPPGERLRAVMAPASRPGHPSRPGSRGSRQNGRSNTKREESSNG